MKLKRNQFGFDNSSPKDQSVTGKSNGKSVKLNLSASVKLNLLVQT